MAITAPYVNAREVEVDVRPAQCPEFAHAQARKRGYCKHGPVLSCCGRIEQPLDLRRREHSEFPRTATWLTIDEGDWILDHAMVAHGPLENAMQVGQ